MTEVRVTTQGSPGFSEKSSEAIVLDFGGPRAADALDRPIQIFETRFLSEVRPRINDLLRIAEIVFAADRQIARSRPKEVFLDRWVRLFRLQIGVSDVQFWMSHEIHEALIDALEFATGDRFDIAFHPLPAERMNQRSLGFQKASQVLQEVDAVTLFSGGADSLAAVLEQVAHNRHPILVSHLSAPPISTRQTNLLSALRAAVPSWKFPHVRMWHKPPQNGRMKEETQRSRSFLFSALSAVVATLVDVKEIYLCDNGVVSINLPQSSQNYGTQLSRSTHPKFLTLMERLVQVVTGSADLRIINSHLFRTRTEVFELIRNCGCSRLLQESVSCAHTEGRTRLQPHCGVCSQCIDRRFASIAAGMEEFDMVERYEIDIFRHSLPEGVPRTHAENYVRFAHQLERADDIGPFFTEFPAAYDAVPDTGFAPEFTQKLFDLFQRHQKLVNGAIEKQLQRNLKDIRRGTLPSDCLLRIVATADALIDPCVKYVNRLRELIVPALPAAFQTQTARNERHVQDVAESVFIAARVELDREAPQIPFAAVLTKPDFSSNVEGALFIEFKYPKSRARLNNTQTEMTSRVTVYRDQGAAILFVVYDPSRSIRDDAKFVATFERHENVWVAVVR